MIGLCFRVSARWVFFSLRPNVRPDTKRNRPNMRVYRMKNGQKMCLIPPAVPLSGTVSPRRWRGLKAPPAGRAEERAILLKGMSGKPEEFFKVERWS